MNLKLTIIPANKEQFDILQPVKEHSEMIRLIDEFEKQPTTDKDVLYLGYFILNGVFNIIHISEAKHIGDAIAQAINHIALPEINKYY